MYQLEVSTAFLNGELNETIFTKQPEWFVAKGQKYLVCQSNTSSIYSIKQSPHCWNSVLDRLLSKMGFTQTSSDLYVSYVA